MKKIDKSYYNKIARLLADCFSEDILILNQVRGINNKDEFLKKLFLYQMPVLNNAYEIHFLDDTFKSVLIGYEKKGYSFFREIALSILCQMKTSHYMNRNDLKLFSKNSREAKNNVDLKWYKEYIKGNYYYIKVIAIAEECRGKGSFRRLMMPIINMCNEKSIPIILETNTPENISIYQHFGFKLVKTIPEPESEADFHLSCLIKEPEHQI